MKAMEFQEVSHARANVTEYEISLAIANLVKASGWYSKRISLFRPIAFKDKKL